MKTHSNFFQHIFIFILFSILFLAAIGAKASENGEIRMEILDNEGQPQMGALVSLYSGEQVMDKKNADA